MPIYTPRVWKDDDNLNNPAGPNDPYLDSDTLNANESLFVSIVNAIIALQNGVSSYTDEQARDAIGAALVGGTGVAVVVNDANNTITVSTNITQYTDELAQDAAASMITSATNSGVSWFYDDSNNKLSATINFPVTSVAGHTGAVTLTKSDVGLDQVNNTQDTSKPVSTAQQAALDQKITKWSTTSPQTATSVQALSNQIVVIDSSAGATITVSGPSNGAPFGVRWQTGTGTVVVQPYPGSGYTIRNSASITMAVRELVTWQLFGSDYQSTGGEKPQSVLTSIFAPLASPVFTGTNPVVAGNATSALQVVPKQQVDALNTPITTYQGTSVSVTSNTTLTLTTLSLTLIPGWWALDGWFSWSTPAATGIKIQFNNNTANSTLNVAAFGPTFGQAPVAAGAGRINYIDTGVLGGNSSFIEAGDASISPSAVPHGVAFVGTTDTITVSFAQNVSTASATYFNAGSWLRAQRIV